MKKELRPRARKAKLVVQRSGDEILIYDLETNEAKCLSSSAAFVWERCDGSKSAVDLVSEFNTVSKSQVSKEFVDLAFGELSRNNLFEEDNGYSSDGFSRRMMIKKVGLTTMAVLPLVAAMVAPSAVQAQTCVPNNGACTVSAQCCSNCCKNVSPGANQCKPGGGACLP